MREGLQIKWEPLRGGKLVIKESAKCGGKHNKRSEECCAKGDSRGFVEDKEK